MGLMEAMGPKNWWRSIEFMGAVGPERSSAGPREKSKLSAIGMSVAEGNGTSLG
jgi:hypothetical protein